MIWIQANRMAGGCDDERRAFQNAMDAAWLIISQHPGEPGSFFVDAARLVLAGVLHGLGHSSPRRVGVVELVQTVHSYERVTHALRATPEGREVYRRFFGGPTATLTTIMTILEDRVLDLLDRKVNTQSEE